MRSGSSLKRAGKIKPISITLMASHPIRDYHNRDHPNIRPYHDRKARPVVPTCPSFGPASHQWHRMIDIGIDKRRHCEKGSMWLTRRVILEIEPIGQSFRKCRRINECQDATVEYRRESDQGNGVRSIGKVQYSRDWSRKTSTPSREGTRSRANSNIFREHVWTTGTNPPHYICMP